MGVLVRRWPNEEIARKVSCTNVICTVGWFRSERESREELDPTGTELVHDAVASQHYNRHQAGTRECACKDGAVKLTSGRSCPGCCEGKGAIAVDH